MSSNVTVLCQDGGSFRRLLHMERPIDNAIKNRFYKVQLTSVKLTHQPASTLAGIQVLSDFLGVSILYMKP